MASTFPFARLRPLDGAVELAAATATAATSTRPEAVTALLCVLLDSVGDQPATRQAIRALPCATREWLVQWTAARLNPGLRWFEARCAHCREPFDLSLDLARPIWRAPDEALTEISVATSLGPRRFAVPTGEHEEQLALREPGADPRRDVASLCGLSPAADEEADRFDEHDLQLIDEALERASPDIADMAAARCPSCGRDTECCVDPLLFAFPREADILSEIHLIASAYGWDHDGILRLPARHRAAYAGMIARERRAQTSMARR
ncbi:hypothetical protein LGR54_05465 [Ancylobacter sp. Lp-2]|uniref:hypothetical protein n=1 Tax=Ancylobacter sp. Lp-2 TaxID=2881339 RepID=UPI001E292D8A|nr:hypothetical protein [Ancylobacter sp. Lp-2]MCB4768044.1 hypothetical protein [Ancylobacter sp. Lp-2]